MVGHLGDLTVDRLGDLTVDRLEGPRADHLVDRTVGRLEDHSEGLKADRMGGRLEGLRVLKQVWLLEELVVELEPFWWALEGASKLLLLLVRPEVLPP